MSRPQPQFGVRSLATPSQALASDSGTLQVHLHKRQSKFELETEFSVVPGITVIVGRSGAGKTTILRCIAGLLDPEAGRIAIGDRLLFDSTRGVNISSSKRRVGFVFQDLALFPHLSVEQNVAYGLRRLDRIEQQRRTSEVMQAFQIEHLGNRFPRAISGGEQQRVALARSLVTEPSVLLLDEPLSSLDPRTKSGIIEDLRRWDDARRIPILYVTHDYEELSALGDRVIALDHGRIAAQGSPREIIPALHGELVARPADFENLFDATVLELHEQQQTMGCQITGTSILLETQLARVEIGSEVRIGIRAADILIASSKPALVGECNVVRGAVKSVEQTGATVDVRVSGDGEFRVRLHTRSVEPFALKTSAEVWLLVRAQACHLVRPAVSDALQRLFLFVCAGNTSRSPMAQALCNAEIASRLGVPADSLERLGIKAISAGLSAHPGEPLVAEAEQALATIGMPGIEHRSGNLTHRLAEKAEIIFCMTEAHGTRLRTMFPEAAAKVHCLQPLGDIDDPSGKGPVAYLELASLLQQAIAERLTELGIPEAA
ncbi:MAG TPA: molybdenum ABC transporter ATP-binding protein [Pyrinomonadaceae bacterium]|jgi:molybdate transport system ATP-binding protein|nr:molybdenum ABC transporter ATP-binding protein [Pyrinomonadaceae bacterium]